MQLGRLDNGGLLGVPRTSQQCLVESIITEGDDNNACIVSDFAQLALQNQSIDALIEQVLQRLASKTDKV